MALEIMKDDVRIIQGLSDYPNQEEGLTAGEMKAKFDEAAVRLKNYLNDLVVPEINGKLSGDALNKAVSDAVELAFQSFDLAKIGAAPAGFGLGKTVAWIDAGGTLSSYMDSGFYSWRSGASDAPFDAGSMVVIGRGNGYAAQLAFRDDHPLPAMAVRKASGHQWTPWEWINPPVELGKEYRTTERYNGKPVYRKFVSCGTITANTPAAITYSSDTNCRPISVVGANSNGIAMQTGLFCTVDSSGTVGTIHKINFGGYMNYITIESTVTTVMYVTVKYYKNTD